MPPRFVDGLMISRYIFSYEIMDDASQVGITGLMMLMNIID